MAASSKTPSISFIIPTLNSGAVLIDCLQSIVDQKYPKDKITILIVDGGSSDSTLKIAKLYRTIIINNHLKTAESAKSLGIKKSTTDFIALIDSDNILPTPTWLESMLLPLTTDPAIIGSEPWSYTYRPEGGFIERYSALTGVNDPYTLVVGNYDRQNVLTGKWTGLKLNIVDHQYYQAIRFKSNSSLPTIGANGTIYKTIIAQQYLSGDYFFDIDFLSTILSKKKSLEFAKVKVGIIHTYCESSISKFYKKQLRRAVDLYTHQNDRTYPLTKNNFLPTVIFCLYVVTLLPMTIDTLRGFVIKPDIAWFFHPLACVITLFTYGTTTIKYKLGSLKPLDRKQWHQ
ncbi:glycosyltransferase family 2 protein [Candidatus Shapirobacteria bacterium]|nr:glycosyltransferase family 2 protein [Candidatus Shapirobacteria bacterium]